MVAYVPTFGFLLCWLFFIALIFTLLVVLVPSGLDALPISESFEIDVDRESLVASRLHLHASQAEEIAQSTLKGVTWAEVPSQHAIVCSVEDLGYAGAVSLRHHLVVRVDVRDVPPIVVCVALVRLGGIADVEMDQIVPVMSVEALQLGPVPQRFVVCADFIELVRELRVVLNFALVEGRDGLRLSCGSCSSLCT